MKELGEHWRRKEYYSRKRPSRLQSRGENCRVEESTAEYGGKYSGVERNITEKWGL